VTTTHRFRRNLWLPAGWYSSFVGWGSRRAIPRALRKPVYGVFSRMVGADLGEVEQDLSEYPTFGEFFARRLREGARCFPTGADEVGSPCDGALAMSGHVEDGTLIQAKGHRYRLEELLADGALAERLSGGWYATIYLSPADYHRVHTPIDGRIVAYDYVPGSLWPVKPWFTENVEGLLARNERAVIHLETAIGPVAVVLIAAIGVGHLQVGVEPAAAGKRRERRRVEPSTPVEVRRGDELGAFLLGSTVVVVFPQGAVEPAPLIEGELLRCGQPLARFRKEAR
jgi:phosphatidylserine decarboxylase